MVFEVRLATDHRLVRPASPAGPGTPPVEEHKEEAPKPPERNGDNDGTDGVDLDPLLIALLKKIPIVEKGWPAPQRVRWFKTFAMNVSQIYDGDDGEPVEMKIEIEKKAAN